MDQTQWNQEQAHLAETLEIVAQERIKVERALGMENGGDRYLMVSDDGQQRRGCGPAGDAREAA